jgi:hypothetical protein
MIDDARHRGSGPGFEKARVAPAALLLASEEGGFFVGASMNTSGGDYHDLSDAGTGAFG